MVNLVTNDTVKVNSAQVDIQLDTYIVAMVTVGHFGF